MSKEDRQIFFTMALFAVVVVFGLVASAEAQVRIKEVRPYQTMVVGTCQVFEEMKKSETIKFNNIYLRLLDRDGLRWVGFADSCGETSPRSEFQIKIPTGWRRISARGVEVLKE